MGTRLAEVGLEVGPELALDVVDYQAPPREEVGQGGGEGYPAGLAFSALRQDAGVNGVDQPNLATEGADGERAAPRPLSLAPATREPSQL